MPRRPCVDRSFTVLDVTYSYDSITGRAVDVAIIPNMKMSEALIAKNINKQTGRENINVLAINTRKANYTMPYETYLKYAKERN